MADIKQKVKDMNFGNKIIIVVSLSIVISFLIIFFFVKDQIESDATSAILKNARAVTLEAEKAKDYISDLRGDYRVFNDQELLRDMRNKIGDASSPAEIIERARTTGYYQTIPIVASWKIGQLEAKEVGFEFRVTRIQARNPKREAIPVERTMLEKMSKEDLKEYWLIDDKDNVLRYMRPITLDRNCMRCHGTEKDYPQGKGYDPMGLKMEGWKVGEQRGAYEIIADLTPVQNEIFKTLYRMIAIGILAIAFNIALVLLIVKRAAINPVRTIQQLLSNVANGDLTVSGVSASHDDIGLAIQSLDKMVKRLNSLLRTIRDGAMQLNASANEIAAIAVEQARNVSSQTSSINDFSAGVNELAATATELGRNTEQIVNITGQAVELANQGATATQASLSSIENVQTVNEVTAEKFTSLLDKVEAISKVLETITNIANKTNLLSVNASIEAVKAGEFGKGFGVVASEIRRLADQTMVASEEIAEMINDAQKAANAAMMSMEKSTATTQEGLNTVRQAGESFNLLIQAVQNIAPSMDEMKDAIDQQVQSSVQMTNMISNIQDSSDQNREGAEQTSQTASSLTQMAHHQLETVQKFKLDKKDSDKTTEIPED